MPPFANVLLVNFASANKTPPSKPGPLLYADHTAALVSGGLRLKAADRRFLRQECQGRYVNRSLSVPLFAAWQPVKRLPANKANTFAKFYGGVSLE